MHSHCQNALCMLCSSLSYRSFIFYIVIHILNFPLDLQVLRFIDFFFRSVQQFVNLCSMTIVKIFLFLQQPTDFPHSVSQYSCPISVHTTACKQKSTNSFKGSGHLENFVNLCNSTQRPVDVAIEQHPVSHSALRSAITLSEKCQSFNKVKFCGVQLLQRHGKGHLLCYFLFMVRILKVYVLRKASAPQQVQVSLAFFFF